MTITPLLLKKIVEKSLLVSKKDLAYAQKVSKHLGCQITDVLIGRDLLKEEQLGELLAKHYKVDFVDLKKEDILPQVLRLIPEKLALERNVVVFAKQEKRLLLAMEDPKDLELIEIIRKSVGNGTRVVPFVATSAGIKSALKLYKNRNGTEILPKLPTDKHNKVSTVTQVEDIFEEAIREESSDIHIEPLADKTLIRFRIDGVLHDHKSFTKDLHQTIVARVKILSELKLDEQRLPQDGQFSFQTKRKEKVSFRVSTIPTVYGEKVVLRILQSSITKFNLEELGLLPEDEKVIAKVLAKTHGMFLVTGPTGSGKTTTLYTLLGLLNKPDVNIITIEDPVENKIGRVNQTQVNSQINLTFANGLRSILRQDPDIIMVGEIRDHETSLIAVNAAMTGHLVFSSVHANTASGAIPRMIDLGVEPFLIASTLSMVVAQRLVRVLCPKCKKQVEISPLLAQKIREAKEHVSAEIIATLKSNYAAQGCSYCFGTGFRGRLGIFEILTTEDDIRQMVIDKDSAGRIWEKARNKGAKSMLEDGLIKVNKGITCLEEVFRVISD